MRPEQCKLRDIRFEAGCNAGDHCHNYDCHYYNYGHDCHAHFNYNRVGNNCHYCHTHIHDDSVGDDRHNTSGHRNVHQHNHHHHHRDRHNTRHHTYLTSAHLNLLLVLFTLRALLACLACLALLAFLDFLVLAHHVLFVPLARLFKLDLPIHLILQHVLQRGRDYFSENSTNFDPRNIGHHFTAGCTSARAASRSPTRDRQSRAARLWPATPRVNGALGIRRSSCSPLRCRLAPRRRQRPAASSVAGAAGWRQFRIVGLAGAPCVALWRQRGSRST
mmetsp:Transcript_87389/g.242405  ORF Transcript_87389/g.242405 Transcript_87389/m.242405 type:complete len:276 (-) Transcript_87389:82-909(-)